MENFTLLLVLILISSGKCYADDLIVKTNLGLMKGIEEKSLTNKTVDVWWSIPFAQPPTGNLRFRHPKPLDPWDGVRDTTELPNSCWQTIDTFFDDFEGATMWNANTPISEDCLYLSVVVPKPRKVNRAVMVWIYGGCYFSGTTTLETYDYKTLAAEQDIIVVAIQYRLGSLGFLYMDPSDIPGNAGIYDNLMALQWIQDNIGHFGGNKHNVTLFGESAGAASIGMMLLSPIFRGLFSQAIMQSGSPTVPWGIISKEQSIQRALVMAKKVGCPSSRHDLDAVIKCFRNSSAEKLISNEPAGNVVDFPFVPIIDGTFLNKEPIEYLKSGEFKKTRILLGSNSNEGIYFVFYYLPNLIPKEDKVNITREQFKNAVRRLFPNYNNLVHETITYEYTDWMKKDDPHKNRDEIDKIIGDRFFTCNVNELAYYYAKDFPSSVYMYYFSHRSSQNKWPKWAGVLHGDEIEYIFGIPLDPRKRFTPAERALSQRIMQHWANFAKTGHPSKEPGGKSTKRTAPYWPVYTANHKEFVTLSTNIKEPIGHGHRLKKCAFWKDYFPKLIRYSGNSNSRTYEQCPGALSGTSSRKFNFTIILLNIFWIFIK